MTKAFRFYETGGSNVLKFEDVEVGTPGDGEVRLTQKAVGLNYIDIYFRSGVYPAPSLPSGLGLEGAGVIEEVGAGVTDLALGDRVAYAAQPLGAYAEARVMPAKGLVKIPDDVSFELAAAAMLQGMTAQYLLRRTYKVQKGRHHPDPRSSRWCWPDCLPVGQTSWCDRDRHSGIEGKGRDCQGQGL